MNSLTPIRGLMISGAVACALVATPLPVAAQGGFAGLAPPDAMDTLSGSSVSGGASNPFQGNAGGNPFGGGAAPGGNPFGGPATGGGNFGGATPGGGFGGPVPGGFDGGFGGGFPGGGLDSTAAQQVQVPMIRAIYGERVFCAVTGALLSDAAEVEVAKEFADEYFDDGESGGDSRADDGLYTNVTVRSDAMSAEAHLAKTRLIAALRTVEEFEPNAFFVVPVASDMPIEGIPNMLELEEQRDARLQDWMVRFLAEYRVTPDAVGEDAWAFYETMLPPPPRTPTTPPPSGFIPPNVAEELQEEQQQDGGGAGDNIPGGGFGGGFPGGF